MGGAKLKKGTEFSSLMYHLDHALQVPTMFYSQQLPSDLTSTEFLDKATNKTSNLFVIYGVLDKASNSHTKN